MPLEDTVYNVIAMPPLVGAVKVTVACPFPATAVGFAGLPGTDAVITAVEGTDAVPAPCAFVALTVKV